ncbi:MAG: hypothetical protein RJA70_4786, partial [Pseudomonadota bacterium]
MRRETTLPVAKCSGHCTSTLFANLSARRSFYGGSRWSAPNDLHKTLDKGRFKDV